MNCTEDLWTECGLDGALTPALTESSVDAQVDRLLAELPPVFVLGGLSLGAIVAMALAVRAPERVAGLCVVSTNAKAPTPVQRQSWMQWSERLDRGESAADLQASIIDALLTPASVRDRPQLVARAVAMGAAIGRERLRLQLSMQATRVDLRPALRELSVPTLVISGAHDVICQPDFHVEIASVVPRARVVSLDAGHLLPLERPSAFGELVRAWRGRPA